MVPTTLTFVLLKRSIILIFCMIETVSDNHADLTTKYFEEYLANISFFQNSGLSWGKSALFLEVQTCVLTIMTLFLSVLTFSTFFMSFFDRSFQAVLTYCYFSFRPSSLQFHFLLPALTSIDIRA